MSALVAGRMSRGISGWAMPAQRLPTTTPTPRQDLASRGRRGSRTQSDSRSLPQCVTNLEHVSMPEGFEIDLVLHHLASELARIMEADI